MEINKIVGVQKLILFSDLHSIPNINYSAQFTMLATEACAYLKNENAAPTALLGKTYPGELPQVDLVGPLHSPLYRSPYGFDVFSLRSPNY